MGNTTENNEALIAENEALKHELQELRERHELIANNIAASVVIHDISGKVTFASPYTQVLTGHPISDIISSNREDKTFFESIVEEQDFERYRRARMVSQLGEEILVRYRIRHRSGLPLWLETRMVPVCDEDGEVVSVMSVTIDVTDSLTYQQQIEEQNRDLSDFAYMVSHDLKAPIFTIRGMASAFLEDYEKDLDEEAKELLQYILDAAKRLEDLVASVIEYSSLATKQGQKTEVDLNTVITNVQADLSEMIKSKKAQIQVPESLPFVLGDQVRIYQVFSNLLGNALKYSSNERQPEISIRAKRSGSHLVTVSVQDNGLGIPENKIDDIFRPYRRAHGNDIEGSGIGLACVKKIVERLGGTVSADSIEGQGSVFVVSFPVAQPSPREVPDDLARLF